MITFLDSTVLVDYLRGKTTAATYINKQFEQFIPVTLSIITQAELLSGVKDKKELTTLEKTLVPFTVVPITPEIGNRAITLLKQYKLSHGLHILDAFIAATAIMHGYPLISANVKHFQMIAELKLIPWPIGGLEDKSALRRLK